MVEIQNAEIINKLSEDTRVSPALAISRNLANSIQPVIQCNPQPEIKISSAVVSDSAGGLLFTSSSTKRTFIVGASLSVSKDVNATSIYTTLLVTPKGQASNKTLIGLRYEPVTAESNITESILLPYPIELEKNTGVSISNSTAIASIDVNVVIYYYEIESLDKS